MSETRTDPAATNTTGVTETTNAGQAGGSVTNEQVMNAIAALTGSVQELTNKVNAIETREKQTSINEDSNLQTQSVGVSDPYEAVRRAQSAYDRVEVMAETNLANMVAAAASLLQKHIEVGHGMGLRASDHFHPWSSSVAGQSPAKVG